MKLLSWSWFLVSLITKFIEIITVAGFFAWWFYFNLFNSSSYSLLKSQNFMNRKMFDCFGKTLKNVKTKIAKGMNWFFVFKNNHLYFRESTYGFYLEKLGQSKWKSQLACQDQKSGDTGLSGSGQIVALL